MLRKQGFEPLNPFLLHAKNLKNLCPMQSETMSLKTFMKIDYVLFKLYLYV